MYGSIRRARDEGCWKFRKVQNFQMCCYGNSKCGLCAAIWQRRTAIIRLMSLQDRFILVSDFCDYLGFAKFWLVSMVMKNIWLLTVVRHEVQDVYCRKPKKNYLILHSIRKDNTGLPKDLLHYLRKLSACFLFHCPLQFYDVNSCMAMMTDYLGYN